MPSWFCLRPRGNAQKTSCLSNLPGLTMVLETRMYRGNCFSSVSNGLSKTQQCANAGGASMATISVGHWLARTIAKLRWFNHHFVPAKYSGLPRICPQKTLRKSTPWLECMAIQKIGPWFPQRLKSGSEVSSIFQQKSSHVTWKGSKSSQKKMMVFRSIREPPMTWLRLFKRQENLQCFPQLWNWRPDFKQSPESSLQSLNTTIHFKIPFKSSSSIPTSRSVLPGGFFILGLGLGGIFVCYFVEWAVLDRRGAASRGPIPF